MYIRKTARALTVHELHSIVLYENENRVLGTHTYVLKAPGLCIVSDVVWCFLTPSRCWTCFVPVSMSYINKRVMTRTCFCNLFLSEKECNYGNPLFFTKDWELGFFYIVISCSTENSHVISYCIMGSFDPLQIMLENGLTLIGWKCHFNFLKRKKSVIRLKLHPNCLKMSREDKV